MSTRANVSQFSSDGSHFVAAFQGSQIRVYDVDKGWKLQKNILAQSLRWTITNTSLSPDQRYLVYASMSPIVHIVNVDSSTRDSHANITQGKTEKEFSYIQSMKVQELVQELRFLTKKQKERRRAALEEQHRVQELASRPLPEPEDNFERNAIKVMGAMVNLRDEVNLDTQVY